MSSNHVPLKRLSKAYSPLASLNNVKPLLSLTALLLFIFRLEPQCNSEPIRRARHQ